MHNILFDIHIIFIREHSIFLRQNVGKDNPTNEASHLKSNCGVPFPPVSEKIIPTTFC